MDWKRAGEKRVSRRWFLGAAGAVAGTAGIASFSCGGGKGPRTPSPAGGEPSPTAGATPSATRPPAGQQGETLRYTGFVASDGVYDPHKTQAGPFYGEQALVFSRLLAYQSQSDGTIAVDLADKMPEQPDPLTLVFTLNQNARWQDRAPLNGRGVTADDVRLSVERQVNGDASFVHRAHWVNVDKMEVSDAGHITFRLKEPRAAMLDAFAGVNAFIVAPELTQEGRRFTLDNQIGSGPFRWVDWSEGKFASVSRNANWHGGSGRPFLDGITITQPKDSREVEAGFRTKELDVAFVGRPQADRLRKTTPELQESTQGHSLFFGMRFFIPQAPYNDVRFRTAVTIALDRRKMLEEFFGGSGEVNPWISWPINRWTLPQSELNGLPGYRPGTGGRDQDISDARALLEAFKSASKLPDDIALFVADDAEQSLHLGSIMKQQLKDTLDLNITVYPMPIAELSKRLLDGQAPWAAGPDNGWIDLDEWVYPYFHSEGTKNSFPLRDSGIDGLIVAQRTELDESQRREIGYEIQRRLLKLNVAANFVSERVVALAWPYVRNFPLDASDGYQHRFADCWIDRNDPSFHGR
jgi:ABC-type transport system substrate-binding protein